MTPNPRYIALVIANSKYQNHTYAPDLPGAKTDGTVMKKALTAMGWKVKLAENLTYAGINSTIRNYFKSTLPTDVCLVYYSGHGDDRTGGPAGALVGADYEGSIMQLYYPYELRNALLDCTQGKVIILLDSCGSGAGIYANGEDESDRNPRNFTQGVMNAFSGYLGTGVEENTGELLQSRFYVLAACQYGKTSSDLYFTSGTVNKKQTVIARRGGTFTYALINSLGCTYPGGAFGGKMTADANGDKKMTLQEAYNGIKYRVNKMNTILKKNQYVAYYEPEKKYYLFDPIDQAVQMGGTASQVLFRK